jgi:hypothetical protein
MRVLDRLSAMDVARANKSGRYRHAATRKARLESEHAMSFKQCVKCRQVDKFIALLPPKDSPYSLDKLSQAETTPLEEAFLDGYGDVRAFDSKPLPLPGLIRTGLLRHSLFVPGTSECDENEYERKFWASVSDEWGTFRMFPLRFAPGRLRLYFANQLDRFCEYLVRECQEWASVEEEIRKGYCAAKAFYQKPWYEYYALRFLDVFETVQRGEIKSVPQVNLVWSARLGRLVEQYDWRFRFEDAATTGVGARRGASAGGKARAALHRAEHSAWQSLASEIWTRRPRLSKIAVAETIKKQKSSARTAKHIARFIKHP